MTRSKVIAECCRHGVFGMALCLTAINTASAQEVCGLANVQFNRMHSDGFESVPGSLAADVATASASTDADADPKAAARPLTTFDLGKALGYAPRIVKGVAPTINIVSPLDAASLPGRGFEVRGTFTGPTNTGITVNGVPARSFGNQWVATQLRPPVGAFTITAQASTFDSLTATATRNINVGSAVPALSLRTTQPGNIAPAAIGFQLKFAFGAIVGNVQIDFDGDGLDDYVGPASAAPTSFAYPTAGFYTARALALVDGNPATADTTVVMADVVAQRQRACAVYGELRAALTANDLEASLATFISHQREALRPFFTALGDNRPVFATRLGTIANGLIGIDDAALTTLSIENGEPVGTQLNIAADSDGVWRISSF